MEQLVIAMQHPETGVRMELQRFLVTPIPHMMTGSDIFEWLLQNLSISEAESLHLGDLIIKYGYIYPLKDPKNLVLRSDDSPYRFQTPYFWSSRKWPATELDYGEDGMGRARVDFVTVSRLVIIWRLTCCAFANRKNSAYYKKEIEYYNTALTRSRVKSSISLEGFVRHCEQNLPHDPIMAGCLPSNPWITNGTGYWTMNADLVPVPTRLRAERWAFSFQELIQDALGRQEFRHFLEKEISAENLSFWEACEDICYGQQSKVEEKVEVIFEQFLAAGASKWVNVDSKTMEKTLDGLQAPHRFVLEDAQMHVYMLMKKDSYPRYLKSQRYRNLLASATVAQESKKSVFPFARWHRLTSQTSGLTARPPPLDARDKAATSTVSQLCRFSHPLANLGVFTGTNIPNYSKDEPSWSHSSAPTSHPGIFPTATSPSCCSVDPDSRSVNETEVSVESPSFVQGEDERAAEARARPAEHGQCGWNTRL
ncbi:regulator of G-protein signaling 11 [Rhinoraja longicauda]